MKINQYTNAPTSLDLENALPIEDFLPPPEQLVKKSKKEKVTILLDSSSIKFFKETAKKHNTKYQAMINEVLAHYAEHYSKTN